MILKSEIYSQMTRSDFSIRYTDKGGTLDEEEGEVRSHEISWEPVSWPNLMRSWSKISNPTISPSISFSFTFTPEPNFHLTSFHLVSLSLSFETNWFRRTSLSLERFVLPTHASLFDLNLKIRWRRITASYSGQVSRLKRTDWKGYDGHIVKDWKGYIRMIDI